MLRGADAVTLSKLNRLILCILGRVGLLAAFLWGLFEATFFFIVPDVIISFAALFSWKRSILHLLLVLIGSLLGGAIMYLWAAQSPDSAKAFVVAVPFIPESMFHQTHLDLTRIGLKALINGPGSGIPYKVYAVQAPAFGALDAFLLMSSLARFERLFLAWALPSVLGVLTRARKWASPPALVKAYIAFWIFLYVLYFSLIQF